MPTWYPFAQLAGMFVIPAVAAVVGVKVSLNGTKERVERIDNKLDEALKTQSIHGERLARIEGGRRSDD